MSEEWTEWREAPSFGCPIKPGDFVEAEGLVNNIRQLGSGVATEECVITWALVQSWNSPTDRIERYRIKRSGIVDMLKRIAANPHEEIVE